MFREENLTNVDIIIIIIIMSFISTGWIAHLVIQTSLQCGLALYTVFTQ
jgi:hypothetical protein